MFHFLIGLALGFSPSLPSQQPAVSPATPLAVPATSLVLKGEPLQLTFGVYQTDKATEMYRKFTPILEALQTALEVKLERQVDIHLRIFKTYDQGLDGLVSGEADFVRFGPASYVLAMRRNADLTLLAREHKKGRTTSEGVLFARANSRFNSMQELRGARIAFGDENSTIGRFLAQRELLDVGLRAEDLGEYSYLGRHDLVVSQVQHGDWDVGAAKESTFRKLQDPRRPLTVLKRFENVTKPWIARSELPEDVIKALKASLYECKHKEALEKLGVSGFVEALPEHYAKTAVAMVKAEKFMLPRPKAAQATLTPVEKR